LVPGPMLAVIAVSVTLSRPTGLFYSGLLLAMPLLMPSDDESASGLNARPAHDGDRCSRSLERGLLHYLLWNRAKSGTSAGQRA